MTELERILKDTLITMERDLTASLEHHETRLVGQQTRLEAQALYIQELRQCINRLQTEQAESARHLQRLSDIHANLEPLLSRLSALLNAG
jgi:hypothetical protein